MSEGYEPHVLRDVLIWRMFIISSLLLTSASFLSIGFFDSGSGPGERVTLSVIGILQFAMLIRFWRSGVVEFHEDRVRVVMMLREHTFRRDEVAGFFKGRGAWGATSLLGVEFVDGSSTQVKVELFMARSHRFQELLDHCEDWLAGTSANGGVG